jgi:N-acetylglucosaminyl-diphospho-decaprenol L-rhamnosyltransferase
LSDIILSIIILNYNTPELVIQWIKSIYENIPITINLEILIVDNGSTDGSVNKIRLELPNILLIENKRNLGFAAGNNIAIRRAAGEFILLLNSDTIVLPGTIERLLEVLMTEPKVAAVGPRVLNLDGTDQDYPTKFPTLAQMIIRNFVRKQLLWSSGDLHTPLRVDCIMGACLMTRREIFNDIGLLDEGFFFYDEDVDWCVRCKKAGWELWLLPEITIIHLKGQTSKHRAFDRKSFNKNSFVELRRSRYRLYQKHAGLMKTLMLMILTDLYILASTCYVIMNTLLGSSTCSDLQDRLSAYMSVLCLNPFGK